MAAAIAMRQARASASLFGKRKRKLIGRALTLTIGAGNGLLVHVYQTEKP